MYAIRRYYVSSHIFIVMYVARGPYVQFWWTDPDWDGATMEQTDINLLSLTVYVNQ